MYCTAVVVRAPPPPPPPAPAGRPAVLLLGSGDSHTCVVMGPSARVKCFGNNFYGQCGFNDMAALLGGFDVEDVETIGNKPSEMGDNLRYMPLAEPGGVSQLALGFAHTCILMKGDGTIRCAGSNAYRQVLDASGGYDVLGGGKPASAITAGKAFNCALLQQSGSVVCWGRNTDCQLGANKESESSGPFSAQPVALGGRAIAIEAGGWHACAILESGVLKCWGNNELGQLGVGKAVDSVSLGCFVELMGDNLPAVDFGGKTVLQLAAGDYFTCALLEGGTVSCFGRNDFGQLGYHRNQSNAQFLHPWDGLIPIIDNPAAYPSGMKLGGPGVRAVSVAAGSEHTCVLLADGTVKCFGNNYYGQCGRPALSRDKGYYNYDMAWTSPADLPSVDLGTGRTASAISCGDGYTCALLDDTSVKCWGNVRGPGDGSFGSKMGNALKPLDLGS